MIAAVVILALVGALVIVVVVACGAFAQAGLPRIRPAAPSEPQGLGSLSAAIYRAYLRIPEAHRPFGDIVPMLTALDIKYGHPKLNQHLSAAYLAPPRLDSSGLPRHPGIGLRCRCGRDDCEYYDLFRQIIRLDAAVQEQDHRLRISAIQGDLDNVQALTERLRTETEIVTTVTKDVFDAQ